MVFPKVIRPALSRPTEKILGKVERYPRTCISSRTCVNFFSKKKFTNVNFFFKKKFTVCIFGMKVHRHCREVSRDRPSKKCRWEPWFYQCSYLMILWYIRIDTFAISFFLLDDKIPLWIVGVSCLDIVNSNLFFYILLNTEISRRICWASLQPLPHLVCHLPDLLLKVWHWVYIRNHCITSLIYI